MKKGIWDGFWGSVNIYMHRKIELELFAGTFILRTKFFGALLKSWIEFHLSWPTCICLYVHSNQASVRGSPQLFVKRIVSEVMNASHLHHDINDCKEWWKCLQAEGWCALLKANLKYSLRSNLKEITARGKSSEIYSFLCGTDCFSASFPSILLIWSDFSVHCCTQCLYYLPVIVSLCHCVELSTRTE